jgi:hypothetical protein
MKSRKTTTHAPSRPANTSRGSQLHIGIVPDHTKELGAPAPAPTGPRKPDEVAIDEAIQKMREKMKLLDEKLKAGFSATVDRKRYDTKAGEKICDAGNLIGEGAAMYDNGKGDAYLHVIEGARNTFARSIKGMPIRWRTPWTFGSTRRHFTIS